MGKRKRLAPNDYRLDISPSFKKRVLGLFSQGKTRKEICEITGEEYHIVCGIIRHEYGKSFKTSMPAHLAQLVSDKKISSIYHLHEESFSVDMIASLVNLDPKTVSYIIENKPKERDSMPTPMKAYSELTKTSQKVRRSMVRVIHRHRDKEGMSMEECQKLHPKFGPNLIAHYWEKPAGYDVTKETEIPKENKELIDEKLINKIVKLFNKGNGKTRREIAEELDMSYTDVCRVIIGHHGAHYKTMEMGREGRYGKPNMKPYSELSFSGQRTRRRLLEAIVDAKEKGRDFKRFLSTKAGQYFRRRQGLHVCEFYWNQPDGYDLENEKQVESSTKKSAEASELPRLPIDEKEAKKTIDKTQKIKAKVDKPEFFPVVAEIRKDKIRDFTFVPSKDHVVVVALVEPGEIGEFIEQLIDSQ